MIWNKERETMPRDALEALQLEQLCRQIEIVYDKVPLLVYMLRAARLASRRSSPIQEKTLIPGKKYVPATSRQPA